MVRGINNIQNGSKLPNCMLGAIKKVNANKNLELPAKIVLASLGITNAIKEPNMYDVFEMKCSDYEEIPGDDGCGWIYDEAHRV